MTYQLFNCFYRWLKVIFIDYSTKICRWVTDVLMKIYRHIANLVMILFVDPFFFFLSIHSSAPTSQQSMRRCVPKSPHKFYSFSHHEETRSLTSVCFQAFSSADRWECQSLWSTICLIYIKIVDFCLQLFEVRFWLRDMAIIPRLNVASFTNEKTSI